MMEETIDRALIGIALYGRGGGLTERPLSEHAEANIPAHTYSAFQPRVEHLHVNGVQPYSFNHARKEDSRVSASTPNGNYEMDQPPHSGLEGLIETQANMG